MTQYGKAPTAELLSDLRRARDTPKVWSSEEALRWIDAGGRPRGFKFREGLSVNGVQLASLYAEGYWKPSLKAGVPDKLSLSLFFRGFRILGIDENGPSTHVNVCGRGRPHYGIRVDHPQLHSVSDDQVYGYAEPMTRVTLSDYWQEFLTKSNILGAPPFSLPPTQLGLPV